MMMMFEVIFILLIHLILDEMQPIAFHFGLTQIIYHEQTIDFQFLLKHYTLEVEISLNLHGNIKQRV